jgi:adenylate cyclase
VKDLFSELKRRKVFRVAVVYVATAFVILQAADIMLPRLGVPEWAMSLVVVLVVLGFPLALVLAWALELTPDGVRVTPATVKSDPAESAPSLLGKRTLVVTGVLVVLGIGLGAGWFLKPGDSGPTEPTTPLADPAAPDGAASAILDASIAVLPFADLSPEGDQQYFADGIAEEILNVLSRIAALSVTSRTSAFAFKSQSELSIPDIAASLGVRHVLEGSVRKAADAIRITAQLIDARSDQHLWSGTFDRELTAQNVFAIQDEIADAITEELARRLDVRIDAAPGAAGGTHDLDAYEAFLVGRDLFINRNYDNMLRSIEMLEQAVAADPDFVRARGWLAMAYVVAPAWGYVDSNFDALAVSAADTALAADPANAEALTALGLARRALPDYAGSNDYYEQAIAADPQATTAHLWLAQNWRNLGYFDHATAATQRCLDVDPNYPLCLYSFAEIAAMQGNYDEAVARLMKVFESSHQESYPHFLGITQRQGDEVLLTLMLRELADIVGPGARWVVPELKRALSDEDYDRDAALARFEARLRSEYPDSPGARDIYTITAWRLAFRAYDRVPADAVPSWWWAVGYPGLAESPRRREAMIQAGLPEYWRAHGFPPQCRAVGRTDFECD